MEYIILITLVLLVASMFFYGYNRGLTRMILSVCMSVAAFVLSFLLAAPIELFLKNNTPVYDNVNKKMEKYVDKYISEEINDATEDVQKKSIKKLNVPSSLKKTIEKGNTKEIRDKIGAETFTEYVAKMLTDKLISCLTFIIVFVILNIGLRVVAGMINFVSYLPLIRDVNRWLGGLLGLAEGIILVWLLCVLVTACASTKMGQEILNAISSNQVLNFIYNNNLITKFLF